MRGWAGDEKGFCKVTCVTNLDQIQPTLLALAKTS